MLYKAVNSTVSFSYSLSTDLQQIRELEYITGLEWKPMADNEYLEKFNFSVTSKELPLFKQIANMQVTWKPSNHLEVKLPKVQFKDAGWYQCQITVSRGHVEKAIHLVVMTGERKLWPLWTLQRKWGRSMGGAPQKGAYHLETPRLSQTLWKGCSHPHTIIE
ncbi:unnamed protein product [Caretta caretta]